MVCFPFGSTSDGLLTFEATKLGDRKMRHHNRNAIKGLGNKVERRCHICCELWNAIDYRL